MGASNGPKSHKTAKKQHQNAPTVKTCKKTPAGRGQPSEIDGRYTLFSVFSEAQGSQQNTQIEAKMESPGTQNHKNPIKRTFKKTIKMQHCNKCVSGCILTQKACTLSHRARLQNHNYPSNPQKGFKGLPRASNISKNHDSAL